MTVTDRRVRLRLVTAFVLGLVSLTLEIAYTRVISFKLFYYYTYFVIGLALLGLGTGSAVVALSRRLRSIDTTRLTMWLAPAAGAIGLLGYAVVARLATHTHLIWEGSAGVAVRQVARLLAMSLSLTAVFFVVGVLLAKLIVAEAHDVRRLYFWDLTGAALACLLAVPLQATIGPPAMIVGSTGLLAVLGVVAAVGGGGDRRTRRSGVTWTAVGAVAVTIGAVVTGGLEVRADETKTLRSEAEVEAGDWGAVFRVDATRGFGDYYTLHHDGLWGSAIWRYDGTPATTDRFATDNRQIPFAAAANEEPHVLIIGAAGGHEIQASLTYGAGQIDAVELNPVTVSLLRDTFADYAGNITEHPDVNYVQGEGRTYLARSDESYDIVWFVAPDSYAASNAATAGAFVMSESYLYTREMIEEAFDHLSPGGVIVAQFGDLNFAVRPMRTARYLVTARSAIGDDIGGDAFADHVGLIYEGAGSTQFETISTIMLFKDRVDATTSQRVQESARNVPDAQTLYLPSGPRVDGVTSDVIDAPDDKLVRIVDEYPLDISAITDDRPFFWHFTDFATVLRNPQRDFQDAEIAIGERLLLMLLAMSAVVAAALLWLPFAITRRSHGGGGRVAGRWRLFVYFASIGLAFMLVEVSMIQRFALLLGFPTLSLSVSLFTLLIATAIGARYSAIVLRWPRTGLPAVVLLLAVIALVYLFAVDPLTAAALAWPQWGRIVLAVVLLLPIGLLLGVFLPTGMTAVVALVRARVDEGRLVAWCWAVNGFFSVLGATLTTILSMALGFDRTVLIGLALYVVAAFVLPSRDAPSDEPAATMTTADDRTAIPV